MGYTKGDWEYSFGTVRCGKVVIANVNPSSKHTNYEDDGFLIAAALDMHEALKHLRHEFQTAGKIIRLTDSHIQNILAPTDKALAKASKGEDNG